MRGRCACTCREGNQETGGEDTDKETAHRGVAEREPSERASQGERGHQEEQRENREQNQGGRKGVGPRPGAGRRQKQEEATERREDSREPYSPKRQEEAPGGRAFLTSMFCFRKAANCAGTNQRELQNHSQPEEKEKEGTRKRGQRSTGGVLTLPGRSSGSHLHTEDRTHTGLTGPRSGLTSRARPEQEKALQRGLLCGGSSPLLTRQPHYAQASKAALSPRTPLSLHDPNTGSCFKPSSPELPGFSTDHTTQEHSRPQLAFTNHLRDTVCPGLSSGHHSAKGRSQGIWADPGGLASCLPSPSLLPVSDPRLLSPKSPA